MVLKYVDYNRKHKNKLVPNFNEFILFLISLLSMVYMFYFTALFRSNDAFKKALIAFLRKKAFSVS